jgi:hypothetical protein
MSASSESKSKPTHKVGKKISLRDVHNLVYHALDRFQIIQLKIYSGNLDKLDRLTYDESLDRLRKALKIMYPTGPLPSVYPSSDEEDDDDDVLRMLE